MDLEHKFCRFDAEVTLVEGTKIEGYASLFGSCDQGGDVVTQGAYAASLKRLAGEGRAVKMLWQHDPSQPIGVWDEVREDGRDQAAELASPGREDFVESARRSRRSGLALNSFNEGLEHGLHGGSARGEPLDAQGRVAHVVDEDVHARCHHSEIPRKGC